MFHTSFSSIIYRSNLFIQSTLINLGARSEDEIQPVEQQDIEPVDLQDIAARTFHQAEDRSNESGILYNIKLIPRYLILLMFIIYFLY